MISPIRPLRWICLFLLVAAPAAFAQRVPAVTFTLTSAAVAAGSPAIGLVTVTDGAGPVTRGMVDLVDGNQTVATLQLVATPAGGFAPGTATMKRLFAPGAHTLKAVFRATTADASAASAGVGLVVAPGNYNSTAALHYTQTVDFADNGAWNFLSSAAVGDVNNDGIPDLVVSRFEDPNGIGIALGDPARPGHFPFVNLPFAPQGFEFEKVFLADLDADGLLDIVALSVDSSMAFYFRNFPGSPGTFLSPVYLALPPQYPQIAIGDFNHDGLPDIAAVGTPSSSIAGNVVVYFNAPDAPGTFTPLQTVVGSAQSQGPYSILAADLNGDGFADLVVSSNNENSIAVLLADAAQPGKFSTRVLYPAAVPVSSIAVGDFNQDGLPDIAAGGYTSTAVVFFGDPAQHGHFLPAQGTTVAGGSFYNVSVGDMNGDGNQDIVGGPIDNYVHILESHPDGTFVSSAPLLTGPTAPAWENTAVVVADLDGDGLNDLVTTEIRQNTAQVFLHDTPTPNLIRTATDLEASSIVIHLGQTLTLTATESATSGLQTGSVEFFDTYGGSNFLSIGRVAISGSTAILQTSTLAVGFHDFVAVFHGDSVYAPSQSVIIGVVVVDAPDTAGIALTGSPNPALVGQTVMFQATASAVTVVNGATGPPTGNVIFYDGPAALATVPLMGGVATFATSSLSAGTHEISAAYQGDVNFRATTSARVVETITLPATTPMVQIAPLPNPAFYGVPVAVGVLVTPQGSKPAPTGSVTVFDGSVPVGTQGLVGGRATITLNGLLPGGHPLTARYAGDTANDAATSSVLVEAVNPDTTATTLQVTPNPARVGQTVTFAVHAGATHSGVVPGGAITLVEGATTLASGSVDAAGGFSFQISTLAPGVHSVQAFFGGSPLFVASSATVSVTVTTEDFALTSNPSQMSLQTEHHAPIAISVQSLGGLADNIRLGCELLPAHATCTFQQPGLSMASGATVSTQLMLDTDDVLYYAGDRGVPEWKKRVGLAATAGLMLFFVPGRRRRRCFPALLLLFVGIGLSGCSGMYPAHTPPGTYTMQVTATATGTGITHRIPVVVVVTP